MRDTEGVRKRYDLVAFVASDTGQKPVHAGGQYKFLCPFHKERTPSFLVSVRNGVQVWHCHGACAMGGDLFEYVRLRKYSSLPQSEGFVKAFDDLNGGTYVPAPADFTFEEPEPGRRLTMQDVERVYHQVDKARDYFHERAIGDKAIEAHKLGFTASHPYPVRAKNHAFPDGNDVWLVNSRRYAIPNFLNESVRAINYRRDDAYMLAIIPMLDGAFVKVVVQEYEADHGRAPNEQELMDLTCPKYQKQHGSKNAIFGADLLISIEPDNVIRYKPRSYAIAVESEMDKLALESQGYDAVAIPIQNALDLEAAFHRTSMLYLIPHNDEAGFARALDWYRRAKRSAANCHILPLPKDFKDPSEMAQAGELVSWLVKRERLEPRT